MGNRLGARGPSVAINSNDEEMYPADSYDSMKMEVQNRQIPFPYLHDKSQQTAKAYMAQCTPDPYLFENVKGVYKLYYHGRINDNWQQKEAVTENSMEEAMTKLVTGEEAPGVQHPSLGCSIKWK